MLQVRLTSSLAMGKVDFKMLTCDDVLGDGRNQGGREGQDRPPQEEKHLGNLKVHQRCFYV